MSKNRLIVIGASTGGPGHLQKIVASIDANSKTSFILIQHMDSMYLSSFIAHLKSFANIPLMALDNETVLQRGTVYVTQESMEAVSSSLGKIKLYSAKKSGKYTPSVDILLESFLPYTDSIALEVVILTGIGDDGAYGASFLEKKGIKIIAESEASAKVYGMPYQTQKLCTNAKVLSLNEICNYISKV